MYFLSLRQLIFSVFFFFWFYSRRKIAMLYGIYHTCGRRRSMWACMIYEYGAPGRDVEDHVMRNDNGILFYFGRTGNGATHDAFQCLFFICICCVCLTENWGYGESFLDVYESIITLLLNQKTGDPKQNGRGGEPEITAVAGWSWMIIKCYSRKCT